MPGSWFGFVSAFEWMFVWMIVWMFVFGLASELALELASAFVFASAVDIHDDDDDAVV